MTSDQEKDHSDHDGSSEGRDLAFLEDPADISGDPKLERENLMLTEQEERDLDTFTLASRNSLKRKTSWRTSQRTQQGHRQDDLFTSQAQSVDSQGPSQGSSESGPSSSSALIRSGKLQPRTSR